MKKAETTFSQQIMNTCQLPKDVLVGAAIISMTGNSEILIENFKNIIKYQPDLIVLQCKKNQIQMTGKKLEIERYTNEEIKIKGYISEIKFL